MRPMRRSLLSLVLLSLSCGPTGATVSDPALPDLVLPRGEDFGAAFTLSEVSDFLDVVERTEAYAGREVLVRARISDVCQKKGCWMVLREGSTSVRVRFEDYGFFVPKDCSGKTAYVQGHVKREVLSEKVAQHYAEESSSGNPTKVRGPREAVSFIASGVRLISSTERNP